MSIEEVPNVSAVANWFGSARMVAERIGREMGKRSLVVVPFAGGMSELPYFQTQKIVVNDRHRHVINLARIMADEKLGPKLYRALRRVVFHPDVLEESRRFCRARELDCDGLALGDINSFTLFDWAYHYAIATWMNRGGRSGTKGEFTGAIPIRFSPGGGGSAQRVHNWIASMPAWRRVMRKGEFSTDDALDVLERTHDVSNVGVYVDADWPDKGNGYKTKSTLAFQRKLAAKLATFTAARVVVRFGDAPIIRELYPRDHWNWLTYPSRAQTNESFDEVLILNGPSYTTK